MRKGIFLASAFLLISISSAFTQDSDLPLQHDVYHFVDRLDILGHIEEGVHTDVKPLGRAYLSKVFEDSYVSDLSYWEKQWFDRAELLVSDKRAEDSTGKGVLRYFYRNGRDLYSLKTPHLQLFINPVARFFGGLDRHSYDNQTPDNQVIASNSRGLVVRGSFYGKVGFYTEVYDNLLRVPRYMWEHYQDNRFLFGEGFVKGFNNNTALDFFHSRAYITVSPIKNMRIKFGQDRAFWGNGLQSLTLSDYSANHLMLNIRTRIWKLEYVNHFAQLIDFIPNKPDDVGTFPRKYIALHQLLYKPTPKLTLGLFESVVYASNLANGPRGFEIQYLNPIIFYRALEQSLGSPDNGMLGFTAKYNFANRFQFYGQLLIDDLNFSEFREDPTYWGNKLGYQAGLKWINLFGIETLDLQAEYNRVRPYVYQHFNVSSNYTHYGQHLGHTWGGNLSETAIALRYHPRPAWDIYLRYTLLNKGLNDGDINYGGDVAASDNFGRPLDVGVKVGQGIDYQIKTLYGRVSLQLFHTDTYLELEGRARNENGINSVQIRGGLRLNLPTRSVRI